MKVGAHRAHGYLVDDVYEAAAEFTRIFGCEPARIDETFAGFPFGDETEFFLWQRKHLEEHLGKDVMDKVKYYDQQAIRCESPEMLDLKYEKLKAEGVEFISEPKSYEWNAYCVYFIDNSGHMWELYCWMGEVPMGNLKPGKEKGDEI
ncbi:MAG: hypothetical protein HFH03_10625 [Dorea sp.]|jgi:predicted lactoylglutathione lyase|nr:hypothetical protein [Dorea sp.]